MPNKNYVNGRRKEYKLINIAKQGGCLSFRSAGSHSPIDVVIIDKKNRQIRLIQCKPNNISAAKKQRLLDEQKEINGIYYITFEVV